MAIKVIVNYPEDPKVYEQIQMNQATEIINCLRRRLGPERLDQLMQLLKEKEFNNQSKAQ